mmetsp:Transcript_90239/g.291784  ORF Transcript_90239/g.291784 Transcript_90239/m.291784 type:complete len:208 (-) Transcript_90239:831-1454(-)
MHLSPLSTTRRGRWHYSCCSRPCSRNIRQGMIIHLVARPIQFGNDIADSRRAGELLREGQCFGRLSSVFRCTTDGGDEQDVCLQQELPQDLHQHQIRLGRGCRRPQHREAALGVVRLVDGFRSGQVDKHDLSLPHHHIEHTLVEPHSLDPESQYAMGAWETKPPQLHAALDMPFQSSFQQLPDLCSCPDGNSPKAFNHVGLGIEGVW